MPIRIEQLGVTFSGSGKPTHVLRDLTLSVGLGEIVAIRGPNGSGKTTLLNVIAGIYRPNYGRISISDVHGTRSRVGFVQQDYTSSLLPWLDAGENISIPLRLKGVAPSERRREVESLMGQLRFEFLPLKAYPHQLSGGQKQRVAIARALISQPEILLLDEPFANLDGPTVRDLQEIFLRVHDQGGVTVVFVSHDLDSSIYLADRIVILYGSPASIRAEIPVLLPHPRCRNILVSAEFSAVRSAVILQEESLYAGMV